MNKLLGKVTKDENGFKVRFERVYPHSINTVWDAITNLEKLAMWFTDMEMELRPGSKLTIFFRDEAHTPSYGQIVAVERPHRFSFTWETELAVFELLINGKNSCKLILTYSKLDEKFAVVAPAGFHTLLDRLEAMLNGRKEPYAFGTEEGDPVQMGIEDRYGVVVYKQFPELEKYKPIVVEQLYHAPAQKVWQALTDKDQMKQWYFDIPEFKAEPGFEFQFTGKGAKGEQYVHQCKIIEVIPQKRLTHSWTYKGLQGNSFVTFELSPEGESTRLKLTHRGVGNFATNNPDFARSSFEGGWTEIIGKNLKEFLSKP